MHGFRCRDRRRRGSRIRLVLSGDSRRGLISRTMTGSKSLVPSSASLKPILWNGGREGKRCGVASQPTKVSFRGKKNRWITEPVDGASYQKGLMEKSYVKNFCSIVGEEDTNKHQFT
uniref:Uncharacterized protein n=1 Tax=Timema genevievae TaxID=629358 RepID=A0A7R9PS44_TIMGE|nr:unnamed protein product [Timema genevievae]